MVYNVDNLSVPRKRLFDCLVELLRNDVVTQREADIIRNRILKG